jgi:hypothetical protein
VKRGVAPKEEISQLFRRRDFNSALGKILEITSAPTSPISFSITNLEHTIAFFYLRDQVFEAGMIHLIPKSHETFLPHHQR